MPQNPNDPYGLGLNLQPVNQPPQPNPSDPYGLGLNLQPVTTPSRPQPVQSEWFDPIVTGAARFALPTLSVIGAGLLAPETGGLSLAALGAGTSGIGDVAAQAYERWRGLRQDYNPYETAVATGAGAIPGGIFGKPATSFLGNVARGAMEAPIIGGALSIPQTYAAEGRMPNIYEMGTSALESIPYGMVGGAAAHGAHMLAGRKPPTVAPTEPIPPEFTQPRIPGMENIDFGQQIPESTYTRPISDTPTQRQARALSAIDTQTEQRMLELRMRQSEAARAGDDATATSLENDILGLRMRASEERRNWQPPSEAPNPVFPEIGGEQQKMSMRTWRDLGIRSVPSTPFEPSPQGLIPEVTPETSGWKFPDKPVTVEDLAPVQPTQQQTQELGRGAGPIRTSETDPTVPEGFEVVTFNSPHAADLQTLMGQGFKSWGREHISPDGKPQLIRKIGEPQIAETAFSKAMTTPKTTVPVRGTETFHADQPIEFPTNQVTDKLIKRMTKQGYEMVVQGDMTQFRPINEQEMRVKGVSEGNTGLENVAIGGADPRVLDVLGSSLYSRPRPITTIKELLQNAFDEHKIAGVKDHVRVIVDDGAIIPNSTVRGRAITVRDKGRGLNPEELYTVFTDLGKTGKAGIDSAAGGFGFAKAAPFLGGKYARISSVVDTPKGRMRYTFEGSPTELKNQVKGVAINAEKVAKGIPTGLEVTTFYKPDEPGFYNVAEWAKNMTERSPSVEGGLKIAETYGTDAATHRRWLEETTANPIRPAENNYLKGVESEHTSNPLPTKQDVINPAGSDVGIHYDIEPGREATEASIHYMNKGMYQGTDKISYGEATANVPRSIVADINAVVEEGHTDYPFSANREQINDNVTNAIDKWVRENIVSGIQQKRVAEIQKKYDGIGLLNPKLTDVHYLDDRNLMTPDEIKMIGDNPKMAQGLNILQQIHGKMMELADSLGWSPESYSATWKKPSERLKKFGILFQAPDASGTVLGIHIPRPDDMNDSSILINLFEHLNTASKDANPLNRLSSDLFTTMAHEIAHVPGGTHDKGFAYRDAQLRAAFGKIDTIQFLDGLEGAFSDGRGNINTDVQRLLQVYNQSRARAAGGTDPLIALGIYSKRPTSATGGKEEITQGAGTGEIGPQSVDERGKKNKPSWAREAYNLPRGLTTTADLGLSAGLRQGLPLITRKEWWTSWNQAIKSLGSEGAYQKALADIKDRPMFQRSVDRDPNSPTFGKITPSFADMARVKIMDLGDNLNRREESLASTWVETGGNIPGLSPLYKGTFGKLARASNRAYTAYLNQLRADSLEVLVKEGFADFKAGTKGARNPYTDLPMAQEIGDFINTATGRGPLRTALPSFKGGGVHLEEKSLERNAKLITDLFFSPRLMASRVRMLNPMTYAMASPFVRKQYLRSLIGVGAAWGTIGALAKMAGADVGLDPNSADFGKIRIGDTRLDPAAGFQQYLVAASRLLTGRYTSSATGQEHEMGAGFQAETQKDIGERFLANKLHPVTKFAYDLLNASQYQPFQVLDRTAQLFVPLVVGDVLDLIKEDPSLLPLTAPIVLGMGSQTYSKGEAVSKFVPKENDINMTNFAPLGFMYNQQ